MKISFIVPIYRKPLEIVRKALESLLAQTHQDREIICVFDGPDPILESYVDKLVEEGKVKKIVIEHGGACKARNAGFRESTGDAISFWDADCYAEPMMSGVWAQVFDKFPNADFVYSSYKFSDPLRPPFETEEFDPWTIQEYNYIASMFPCRREKVVEWDESLDGLQDWDYWRRVCKNGARGYKLEGYGFTTEYPDKDSISGQTDKRVERINRIREKNEDRKADILIWGAREQAVKMAKYLDADHFCNTFYKVHDYRMEIIVGFHPKSFQQIVNEADKTQRVLYWTGWDAVQLQYGPYLDIKKWLAVFEKQINVHLCDDKAAQDILENMGIKAEIVPLPRQLGDVSDDIPKELKVFVYCDPTYEPMVDTVIKGMPDVNFVRPTEDGSYRIEEFMIFLQFTQNTRLEEGSRNALLNGRYLISNVEEPFCGFIDMNQEPTKTIDAIINKIDEYRGKNEINKEAREYWMERLSPNKFKESIRAYVPSILEVV